MAEHGVREIALFECAPDPGFHDVADQERLEIHTAQRGEATVPDGAGGRHDPLEDEAGQPTSRHTYRPGEPVQVHRPRESQVWVPRGEDEYPDERYVNDGGGVSSPWSLESAVAERRALWPAAPERHEGSVALRRDADDELRRGFRRSQRAMAREAVRDGWNAEWTRRAQAAPAPSLSAAGALDPEGPRRNPHPPTPNTAPPNTPPPPPPNPNPGPTAGVA
ncbi:hypothetical protein ACFU99_13285, partial [Streptomyces sp. NPDC057654]